MKYEYYLPENVSAEVVRTVRERIGISQREFAQLLRVSKSTIERWEAGDEPVTGPIVMLTYLLRLFPELAEEIRIPEMKTPLRLWYYHNDLLCSLIDVDDVRQRVYVKNYIDNIYFRAFGALDKPDYEAYQAFLRSRCFPEERDMVKLELEKLGLPFYDPMMIIEKTEGRMAEDNFWIRIERNYDRIV